MSAAGRGLRAARRAAAGVARTGAAALLVGLAASAALAAETKAPPRARYQYLVAEWELAHGRAPAATAAAQTALLHDPAAAAPRLLLAGQATGDDALRLLEEAARSPSAPAPVWTALGVARARAGSPAAADAFAEAEARGGGAATFAAWWPYVAAAQKPAVARRWLAVADPGPGGRAARATAIDPSDAPLAAALCTDALAAVALGEPLHPGIVASRCGPAGRAPDARRALGRLAAAGSDTADAEATLRAWSGSE